MKTPLIRGVESTVRVAGNKVNKAKIIPDQNAVSGNFLEAKGDRLFPSETNVT